MKTGTMNGVNEHYEKKARIGRMRKALMILLCAVLTLGLCSGVALAEEDSSDIVELAEMDALYEALLNDALPYAQSEHFSIAFRVCEGEHEDQEYLTPVLFQLDVTNTSDRTLQDFSMTAHLNPTLQTLLVSSTWYNEPLDLGAQDSETAPRGITYSWDALLDLRTAAMLDGVQAETFYDMVIELSWKGGSEVLRIAPEDMETLLEQAWIEPEEEPASLMDAALAESITQAAEVFR